MNPLSLWERICGVRLEPDQEQLVRVVNRLSPKVTDTYAWLEPVEQQAILGELGWNDEGLLWAVASQLHELGFADNRQSTVGDLRLSATYRGLIWETRRRFTLESRLIDDLVAEWVTTSVDFKRELHTDTADQKAELIKDVIGLANTQASGRRGIIIGFDDKTRDYFGPPIPKLTQNHFEQLVAQYASPVVDLRWEVVDSRAGKAGKLEVIRDRTKLPHRVAKSIGDKRRVSKDQVFVRHGSQTETPTPYELSAIEEEGERARGKPPE